MSVFLPLVAAIAGYLLGSIPFGLVLTKLAGGGDIRTIGSGNIGATNVLRTGRKGLAAATLILDGAKGAVAVLIGAAAWGFEIGLLAGFAAVIGHLYPVWIGFKGGKGVATTLGVLIAVDWMIGLSACIVWLLVAGISRISSLAALVAVASAPLIAWLWPPVALDGTQAQLIVATAAVLAGLVWIKHLANIQRLLKGEEPRIGRKAAAPNA